MKNTKSGHQNFRLRFLIRFRWRDVRKFIHELYVKNRDIYIYIYIYLIEPKTHSNIFTIGISNDAKKVSPFTKCSVSDGKKIF